ncbi:hypothetical protein C900_03497 [Fulvivirga imtechensis AK7]|uniref:DUF2911 domain-containing protein n=1 Tax=Fulvivirga imtechensis AK7 TaxID=1237149 RepID=L8JTB2_9BACT|nr:DUF2911 domain-containing protein [Fulvivirga imtechensis]ELR70724.1 hypothetical protein C900_03497 [Fulvivirga imtechensis AK7]
MRKIIVVGGIIVAVIVIGMAGMRFYTKSFSPQDTAIYQGEHVAIKVDYSRPYKKDREIFGGLVPYGEVWRTGANETTTFTTNKDLRIGNKLLKAGSYSLFTIPGPDTWTVIFNQETGQWGVSPFSGRANRDPEKDVLTMEIPSIQTKSLFEQFTISFERMGKEIEMILMWDHTLIVVPIYVAEN